MLAGDKCSIYEHRPRTCRDYDCRVFAATGINVDAQTQPDIADRVNTWVFSDSEEASREEQRAVKNAAALLQNKKDWFPHGSLPAQPVQLAALAIRVHRLFRGEPLADAEVVRSIPAELDGVPRIE